jgi:hypothetical protein
MENRRIYSHKKEYAQPLLKCRIPFLEGRPKRDTSIGHDDCVNLEIALNTCKDVDEFLKMM